MKLELSKDIITKEESAQIEEVINSFCKEVQQVVHGKVSEVELALTGAIVGGHLLIEDVPGVGKTTLARSLAETLGGHFHRVQCTADLLPSDLTGINVYHPGEGRFHFQPGPLFTHILLADELNRATPKAQSSLLEAMEEHQVTIDRITHPLPDPFWVIATQNPRSFSGTFMLPESQLDRFALSLSLGHLNAQDEKSVLLSRAKQDRASRSSSDQQDERVHNEQKVETWRSLRAFTQRVTIHGDLVEYVVEVASQTRHDPELRLGVSTRGALSWIKLAQARALMKGRSFVSPEDLKVLSLPALVHRIWPSGHGGTRQERLAYLEAILTRIPLPR